MAAAPELEPAVALTLKRLLIPLGTVLVFSVTYGVSRAAEQVARAFFGTLSGAVGWIPFVGDVLTAPIHKVAQKINHVLAAAALASEREIGDALHTLAALVRAVGQAIENAPMLAYALAKYVTTLLSVSEWRKFYTSLVGRDRVQFATAKEAKQIAAKIRAREGHTAKVAAHAQARSVALPGEIAHDWNIPGLRDRVKELEDGAVETWKWIRTHGRTVAAGAFVGTVAWALSRLGASWIRCRNWKRIGRQVCATDPSTIESLLADMLVVAGSLSLVEFARELQPIVNDSARVVQAFWRVG